MSRLSTNQKGFTIIELLIATAIFSIVLLVIAGSIIQIGRLYYKSLASSRTQEATRSIISDISESIQFNPGIVVGTNVPFLNNGTSRGICVGSRLYSYRLGVQQSDSSRAMVVRNMPSDCSSTVAQNLSGASVAGNEMLSDKMRLTKMQVVPLADNSYRVIVRVVYGDADILCNPAMPDASVFGCTSTHQRNAAQNNVLVNTAPDLTCKNIRSGTQFCSVSELSKIVKRRL